MRMRKIGVDHNSAHLAKEQAIMAQVSPSFVCVLGNRAPSLPLFLT